jgi:hypothetical protein
LTRDTNQAAKDGSLAGVINGVMEQLRPEAAYFLTEHGKRTALVVFDLKDPSQIPVLAEPLFHTANAAVELTPVMTADELQAGLEEAAKAF